MIREQDWPDGVREAVVDAVVDLVWAVTDGSVKLQRSEFFREIDEGRDLDTFLAALAPHVTPTEPLRKLAAEWDALPVEQAFPHAPIGAHKFGAELREVIDRG